MHRRSRFKSAARIVTALLTLVAIASWPGSALAWSARGHAMVADIATQFLTPDTQAAVAELLRGDLNAEV